MKKILPVLLLLLIAGSALAEKANVVILTGANNHDWKATTPVLQRVLEGSGQFEVVVVTEPEKLATGALDDADVLLSNWNAFGKEKPAPWSEALKKAYVEFVRSGGGHVVVHAGSASFYDWADYQTICLATWKGGTGHKKPHEFDVRMTAEQHPVTCGCADFKTHDELWFNPFVESKATILAESYSRHTEDWEPTALVGQFGEGRCFTLLLGHDAYFMQNSAGFQDLLIRGTTWVAGE